MRGWCLAALVSPFLLTHVAAIDEPFHITLRSNPALCLDLAGGATDNGTPIQIWPCNGLENQLWFFTTGSYELRYGGNRNKCIDAGSMQQGNKLMLWDCNGLAQQTWSYDGNAAKIFLFKSSSQCMDLSGGDTHYGNAIQIWGCNGLKNQQWNLVPGLTIRMAKAPNVCLDVYGGKTDNGTPVNVWECNGLPHQLFYFDAGAYQIQYAGDRSKCLDAGNMQDGAKLMLWDCNGLDQQRWGYDKSGTVFLTQSGNAGLSAGNPKGALASKCMDLAGGSYNDGTPIQLWDCNGCWNQLFQIIGPAPQGDFASVDPMPNGCPPVPSPPPPPAPPAPKPAPGNFLPHCTSKNQYGWPKFDDYKSLAASPWGGYFKDVYGWIPVSGYPICTFDFWFLYESKIKKNNIKTPMAIVPGQGKGVAEGTWFQSQWSLQPADASWIKHMSIPTPGFVQDNTWIEITHHQVGTPNSGDEVHGAWFVFAPGTNVWFNVGKTAHYPNHGAAATALCGHGANDPQTAVCGMNKGLDSYQFVYTGSQGFGISDFNEVVAAKRIGGYPCTTSDVKNAFRVGWEAALACTCDNAQAAKNANCQAGKHLEDEDLFVSPAAWRYGAVNESSRSVIV